MKNNTLSCSPSLAVSCIPVIVLICSLIAVILIEGATSVINYGYILLLGASALALLLSVLSTDRRISLFRIGMSKSARQILPTVPILLFIGTLSATWMLSGVVPSLISYGIRILNPQLFLFLTCIICSIVSVVTGSSWTTIATIGVAFMGIGEMFGYPAGWIAGAIISGAYFGDKISPLSDTTVLAASSTGVDLFSHIRFMMLTTIPAMSIALIVFGIAGFMLHDTGDMSTFSMLDSLERVFNVTPWVLIIPAVTLFLIALRLPTLFVLFIGTLTGLIGIFLFQPQIVNELTLTDGFMAKMTFCVRILCLETGISTGNELLDQLISTGGIQGMLPTIYLILSGMIFGGIMIGSGMLGSITRALVKRLRNHRSVVSSTVGSGIFLNGCTGDQYLSIIIGANMFRNTFRRCGIRPLVLSRSLEDSISVTSVLIPWNSCGLTQATVLGVATLNYLPYCIFNLMSPLMSLTFGWFGWKIANSRPASSRA